MWPVGFEPKIPESERRQTHVLERAVTVIGFKCFSPHKYIVRTSLRTQSSSIRKANYWILYRSFIPCMGVCGFESCQIVPLNIPRCFAALFDHRMVNYSFRHLVLYMRSYIFQTFATKFNSRISVTKISSSYPLRCVRNIHEWVNYLAS
jgi:hypothetical protein